MHIDLGSGNVAPSLTQADMPPPGNQLLGVLETTRTHVKPIEHRRLVVRMVSMCPLIRRVCPIGNCRANTRRAFTEDFLSVVGRVPGPEAYVTQHDLIDVTVRPLAGCALGLV
jgi:hypothetical protein